MSHVLVTGASGFIGRAVIAALTADGHTVRAQLRQQPQPGFSGNVEVMYADFTRSADWPRLVEGMDVVIHLAGVAHTGRAVNAETHDRLNRQATIDLASAAGLSGVKRFIFVSSVRAQSGPAADHVLTERDAAAPTDAYGRSKLAAEVGVQSAGVPFVILRPVLVYGLGAKGNFAALMRLATLPLPLPVRNFTNRRSLLGIDNVISALRLVISSPAAIGETYLVADPGIPPTLYEVIVTLREAHHLPPLAVGIPPRYVEIMLGMIGRDDIWQRLGRNLKVDIAKLMNVGWQPLHDTRSGLLTMTQKS